MSIFGRVFRVATFGQSHSKFTGCVVENFPANFKVNLDQIQYQLNRRKPGQSSITTPRKQNDLVQCISGLQNEVSQGSPLCFIVPNQNTKKKDYSQFKDIPRPGHADFTYLKKYGIKSESGGGRSSARQTIGRVIAGALAKQYLQKQGIAFASWVSKVGNVSITSSRNKQLINRMISNQLIQKLGQVIIYQNQESGQKLYIGYQQQSKRSIFNSKLQLIKIFQQKQNHQQIQKYILENLGWKKWIYQSINSRCPDLFTSIKIIQKIKKIKSEKDSIGGIVTGAIYNMKQGLGQPIFDKLPALMAHGMLSIPATKGFQYGSGFGGSQMQGSQHNDMFQQKLSLKTNNSGGSLGGISTGQTFYFNVAFKPVSTIGKQQNTHDLFGNKVIIQASGRHDPCVLPRAPPIIDSMAAMVIMDLFLLQKIQKV